MVLLHNESEYYGWSMCDQCYPAKYRVHDKCVLTHQSATTERTDFMSNPHLLVHALTEVHLLGQTLAAVLQVYTQEHLISKVLLGLSKTCIQLTTQKHSFEQMKDRSRSYSQTEFGF